MLGFFGSQPKCNTAIVAYRTIIATKRLYTNGSVTALQCQEALLHAAGSSGSLWLRLGLRCSGVYFEAYLVLALKRNYGPVDKSVGFS